VNLAAFRYCLAEYTVHSLSPRYCLLYWCCRTVLPDGETQHNFLQNWCNFTCLCAWASEGFFQGGTTGFFQTFFQGGHEWWNFFFHSKL